MQLTHGPSFVHLSEVEAVLAASREDNVPVHRIITGSDAGRSAFFHAVENALPLDPPLVRLHSWDALADSLWEGVYSLEERQLVILWEDSARYRESSPIEYRTAVEILTDITQTLADPRATVGNPKDVYVYIVHG